MHRQHVSLLLLSLAGYGRQKKLPRHTSPPRSSLTNNHNPFSAPNHLLAAKVLKRFLSRLSGAVPHHHPPPTPLPPRPEPFIPSAAFHRGKCLILMCLAPGGKSLRWEAPHSSKLLPFITLGSKRQRLFLRTLKL